MARPLLIPGSNRRSVPVDRQYSKPVHREWTYPLFSFLRTIEIPGSAMGLAVVALLSIGSFHEP